MILVLMIMYKANCCVIELQYVYPAEDAEPNSPHILPSSVYILVGGSAMHCIEGKYVESAEEFCTFISPHLKLSTVSASPYYR
jgi:hypothetical protein